MAFTEYIEHTCMFIPEVVKNFGIRKTNNNGYVYHSNDNNLGAFFYLNKQLSINSFRTRWTSSTQYAVQYKKKYYYVGINAIYGCTLIDENTAITTEILVLYGRIKNINSNYEEAALLVHSDFDLFILKKNIYYNLKYDNNDKILLIRENLFNYVTRIEKSNISYINASLIPTLKTQYLEQLQTQIEEL